jgi:hypothetical protein
MSSHYYLNLNASCECECPQLTAIQYRAQSGYIYISRYQVVLLHALTVNVEAAERNILRPRDINRPRPRSAEIPTATGWVGPCVVRSGVTQLEAVHCDVMDGLGLAADD